VTHRKRYRQPDDEPALDELRDLMDERRVSARRRRKWHHHKMHEEVNQRSINEPAKHRATGKKWKLAAGQIVDRSRPQRDHELQQTPSAAVRPPRYTNSRPAGRWQSSAESESAFAECKTGSHKPKIQYPDNQSPDDNRRKRARAREG